MAFLLPAAAGAAGTMGTIGSIASIASTGLTVLGALKGAQGARMQGKAEAGAARFNAAVASNNAIIARRNADLAAQEGTREVEQKQMETRAKLAAMSAAQGASGVDMNFGSSVDVRSSAAETGQLNAIDIRSNAARKAYGWQQNAADLDAQSGLYKSQAKYTEEAGEINAQTSLLGGLSAAGTGFGEYLEKRTPLG